MQGLPFLLLLLLLLGIGQAAELQAAELQPCVAAALQGFCSQQSSQLIWQQFGFALDSCSSEEVKASVADGSASDYTRQLFGVEKLRPAAALSRAVPLTCAD